VTQLLVAPITHSPPERPGDAVEIPARVKRQLGLDGERSWIVATELNRFLWPGPDLRIALGKESPLYDALPERLFEEVRAAIVGRAQGGRLKITKRSE
jgi:hypothetical protein